MGLVKIRLLFFFILATASLVGLAPGIIVISPDETQCQAPPPDGSPWNYVAGLEDKAGSGATGVYLGNRYLLTANHLDNDIHVVHLNGTNYATDDTFRPIALEGTDLRVFRMATDPGLPPLPLISVTESEFDKPCTMIGYGVGKGAPAPNQGWNWGDEPTRLKRWATSKTSAKYHFPRDSRIPCIQTTFDFMAGPTTGQITVGDAGCGLFEKLGGVWKLVGIGVATDLDKQALYDTDLATPGFQPDHSYFAPIHRFVIQLKRIVAG